MLASILEKIKYQYFELKVLITSLKFYIALQRL